MSSEAYPPPVVAVLGLGEAGKLLSADLLKAGVCVQGYDPVVRGVPGVVDFADEASAVSGADFVMSVNSAYAALDALKAGMGAVGVGVVWADLNTASPGRKLEMARTAESAGVRFADVAVMAPVPGRGLQVPLLICGDGAADATDWFNRVGGRAELMPGPPGTAAARKLLRSVFFKSLSTAIIEAIEAARRAGCEDWLRANIINELTQADASTVDRIIRGTMVHAARRTAEMEAAVELLTELDIPPVMAAASRDVHRRLVGARLVDTFVDNDAT